MKKTNWKELKNPALLFPAAALLLLIVAWIFHKRPVPRGIFAVLSALVSLYGLLPVLLEDLKARNLRSGVILLVLSAVLYAVCGRLVGAALALLVWNVGQQALKLVQHSRLSILQTRRAQSPLLQELPELAQEPMLSEERERLLRDDFPLLMIVLAALAAILTAVVTKNGAAEAIRRAAVVLALSGSAAFFLAFPFGDLAAAISAGEKGVLFRGSSLSRLTGFRLACTRTSEGVPFGDAVAYPAQPDKLNAETMVKLAALALSKDKTLWSEQIAKACHSPTTAHVRTKVLKGFGVAAQAADMTILCGNAEFMKKAELPVLPFAGSDSILHIAVNGVYAGCIDFAGADAEAETELTDCGFFSFGSEAEAAEQRLPGEEVLFASPDGRPAGCGKHDLFVSAGISEQHADIVTERCGSAGLRALARQLQRVKLCRKGLLLLSLTVKAVLFLMALFGICPLWLAVALEAAEGCFSIVYAMRALDADSKF